MSITELRDAIALLAPGFIALKVFYLFGAQRPRSQWEWVIWSLLVSLPLDWATGEITHRLDPRVFADPTLTDAVTRLVVATGAGVIASVAWRTAVRSDWGWLKTRQRDVTDSAFDLVMEEAARSKRPVEVAVRDGGDATSLYRGWIHTVARESARAEPWFYISSVETKGRDGKFRVMPSTHGVLFHRDRIERIRVFLSPAEAGAFGSADATAASTESQRPSQGT